MFVGHLAVALGAKKVEPDMPLAAGVAAAFGIDMVWPILLLIGAETVSIAPGNTAFTHLAFESYPWSHSLLLVLGWSTVAVVVGRVLLRSATIGWILGGLVLSHWVLDAVTHRPDLPLWPGGPMVGLGLWNSIPGTIAVEGLLFAACIWAFTSVSRPKTRVGTVSFVVLLLLTGLIWITQPWAPPPPSATAVAWTAGTLWLLVPWAYWIEKNREVVS